MGLNVLVVDDDPIAQELLSNILEENGFAVELAADGAVAWKRIESGSVRLVICDWEMPQMTGTELCRRVRSSELPGYVYIILVTQRTEPNDLIEGLAAGADDFVTKPVSPAELTIRARTGERILSLQTRELVIFLMAKLAESRDPETGEHLDPYFPDEMLETVV